MNAESKIGEIEDWPTPDIDYCCLDPPCDCS